MFHQCQTWIVLVELRFVFKIFWSFKVSKFRERIYTTLKLTRIAIYSLISCLIVESGLSGLFPTEYMQTQPPHPRLSFAPIFMIDAHSAERNEKSIFRFLFMSCGWLYLQFTGDAPGYSSVLPSKKKVVKCKEKMHNELKRLKNPFSYYYFFSYVRYCTQNSSKIYQFLVQKRLYI